MQFRLELPGRKLHFLLLLLVENEQTRYRSARRKLFCLHFSKKREQKTTFLKSSFRCENKQTADSIDVKSRKEKQKVSVKEKLRQQRRRNREQVLHTDRQADRQTDRQTDKLSSHS